jgi:hypothetical protein
MIEKSSKSVPSMTRKPFALSASSRHFPMLEQQDTITFRQNTFCVPLDASVSLADLVDPQVWGPQRMVAHGDIVNVMRADGAFYAQLLCIGSASGYPTFKVAWVIHGREVEAQDRRGHIDLKPGAGWRAIVNGCVIASDLPNEDAAKAALAEALERAQ